ncbi:MAG: chromosome partitioning protein [Flavobacteriales bacterium]|nr:chromosome partitioning protein [Flavobacteriales bacterium]
MIPSKEKVLEALSSVQEPDLKKDIVDLNLVGDIMFDSNSLTFSVKVHNPAMHNRKKMAEACEFAIHRFLSKEINVTVKVIPLPKDRDPEQRKVLPGVRNIIAVSSGKGGVGKSTITSNLAVGLAELGYSVGLVDADIYGPSMPLMFDVANEKPSTIDIDGKNFIKPIENYGVKMLSIGFFADINQAIVWRGPMASKALKQMFVDTYWGSLDYLLIDLPPGTGDIHLSLVQTVPVTGAVVVSTPQGIALADAKKGVGMFQLENINVPVLGIVENMAFFTPAELPDNKYYIFGKDGGVQLAEQLGVNLLGQIPLVQSICESGEAGRPAILQETTPQAIALKNMVIEVDKATEIRNKTISPTKLVKLNN